MMTEGNLGHHTSSPQGWLLGGGFCVFMSVSVCMCCFKYGLSLRI